MPHEVTIPTLDQIVMLHDRIIHRVGGSPGLRSIELLASAWAATEMAMHYGQNDVVEIACKLGNGIIRNHPFIDGNKRAAWGSMLMTFSMNGHQIRGESKVYEKFAQAIIFAAGERGASIQHGQDLLVSIMRDHVCTDPVHERLFEYDLGRP